MSCLMHVYVGDVFLALHVVLQDLPMVLAALRLMCGDKMVVISLCAGAIESCG